MGDAPTPSDSATAKGGPPPFDTSVANQARIYDYLLGGKDNYAADRAAVDAVLKIAPEMGFTARANRAFLGRVVRYLTAEAGMRQFLDVGTGIPTAGNVHEVAQAIAPESRVVYVDYDPIVLAHARALLTSDEAGGTEYIDADLRDTDAILTQAAGLLDLTKPVAVTLLLILHVIPDSDDPQAIVAAAMDALPSGSYLALSHLGSDLLAAEAKRGFEDIVSRTAQQQYIGRRREQIARLFEGMDLVEPGLVRVEEWRPDLGTGETGRSALWCALGRKRLIVDEDSGESWRAMVAACSRWRWATSFAADSGSVAHGGAAGSILDASSACQADGCPLAGGRSWTGTGADPGLCR
ncbi:MAG: SAM-dependent methyltransferase [Trebonia sp.]